MAVKFDVPKSPTRTKYTIDEFLGVDFSNSGVTMDKRRSPNAPNMVRHTPKKIRKRMGYKKVKDFSISSPVYGAHVLHLNERQSNGAIDTNRVLGTSSTYEALVLDKNKTNVYEMGSYFHKGQTIYYSFDYTLYDGVVNMYLGDTIISLTKGKDVHKEGSYLYNPSSNTSVISGVAFRLSDTNYDETTLYIKNLICSYSTSNEFIYSPAPEDVSETFDLSNVYTIASTNLASSSAVRKRYSYSTESAVGKSYDITLISDPATSLASIQFVQMSFTYSNSYGARSTLLALYEDSVSQEIISFDNNPLNQWNKKIKLILPTKNSGKYLKGVRVVNRYFASAEGDFTVALEGLKIAQATPKTTYESVTNVTLYHVGNKLYSEKNGTYTTIYTKMNSRKSRSWQIESYLYIVDGKNFIRYSSSEGIENVSDVAEIPLVTIGKKPSGGGTSYNDRNLIQAGYEERFTGTKTDTTYQMSFYPLDENSPVVVKILDSNGNLTTKINGYDYWVDYDTGEIEFNTAPGVSPITGEDNVYITAFRSTPGYEGRITNCTLGTLYGVNGNTNRLFLSGNPAYPNYDWYSDVNNPTYFPDMGYSVLGSSKSPIMGYLRTGDYLATIKNEADEKQSVFIRSGEFSDDGVSDTDMNVMFRVVNTLQGAGGISKDGYGYLRNESLFLTKNGIMAITSQDVTGEKLSQTRSFFLDGKLTKETDLENACVCVFNDYYIVATNNKFYMLDGLQPSQTDSASPYSTRLYSAFYCDNIPAYTLWENDGELFFGTNAGVVYKFYTDSSALESYNDNGKAISSFWESPDMDGKLFYKNKTFRYLAVRLMSSLATSVKIWGEKHGIWTLLKTDNSSARYFAFSKIVFSKFSFSVDKSEQVAYTKMRIKKVDKARFKLENSVKNEPFGIYDFALEYIESGNYKG